MKVLLVGINAKFIHAALPVYALAAACRQAGRDVAIAEYTVNQEFLQILGAIADLRPEVAGFACYIWNRDFVLKLAVALKKIFPTIKIIVGGPEASGNAAGLLSECRAVDFVIQGEGEESLPELLQQLEAGERRVCVAGVAIRTSGGIDLNGGFRVVADLSKLPFPYAESQMQDLRQKILYYESTRGCPFACSYCVSGASGGVRRRRLEQVREELRFFLRHEVMQVKFVDRTFNARPEHYREIWRFLLNQPGNTGFHFEIVADLLSEEDIEFLRLAPKGKFQFEIGIQSTNDATLAAIGRKNRWEILAGNVRRIAAAGNIHLHLDLIVGLPEEDWQRFAVSFDSTYALQPNMLQIGFLKLLPGTGIHAEASRYGYIWLDDPPYEILANDSLSFGEVRRLKILAEVFDQTYNSGRFGHTLAYLVRLGQGGSAFAFYDSLSRWWQKRGHVGVSHSPEGVLNNLLEYSQGLFPDRRQWVEALLKVDALLEGRNAMKGGRLDWNNDQWAEAKNELWRNETEMRRYVPLYTFSNWREVKRHYPIEVFAVPVVDWLERSEAPEPEMTPVLFDLAGKTPHWHALPQDLFSGRGRE